MVGFKEQRLVLRLRLRILIQVGVENKKKRLVCV